MNSLNLKKITENLINTFIKAGKVAKDLNQKELKIIIKKDNSPVTNGDLAVDEMLRNQIANLTPNIPIVSEETVNLSEKNINKNFWLIDPIDGTKEYIKKGDEYTLNAALIVNLQPAIGVVYAPKKERLFFSYGKNKAFEISNNKTIALNCEKKVKNKIIALINSDKIHEKILDIHKKYKVDETIKMSSSYKFCVLAAGEADIYAADARAFEWDIAAGQAILEHAGGFVTSHEGKKFLYGKENYKNLPLIALRSSNLKI